MSSLFHDTAAVCEFFVEGVPAPGGSKRVGVVRRKENGQWVPAINPRTGMPKTFATDMSGQRGKTWRADVRDAARKAMGNQPPYDGPLTLQVVFRMPRPKSHYGSGQRAALLKLSAPAEPITAPDATKLLRALEDALHDIVFANDAQVTMIVVRKLYADGQSGAEVRVGRL